MPPGSENKPEGDDDEVKVTGHTDSVTQRWMKKLQAIRELELDAPSLTTLIRGRIYTMRSRSLSIFSNLKLGVYELELFHYSKKLTARLDATDRKEVRFTAKLTPWKALVKFPAEFL